MSMAKARRSGKDVILATLYPFLVTLIESYFRNSLNSILVTLIEFCNASRHYIFNVSLQILSVNQTDIARASHDAAAKVDIYAL